MAHRPVSMLVGADQNLSAYIRRIQRYPLLDAKTEQELGIRWHDHGDERAAHMLINSHLRLVAKIAMGYRGYGLPVDELVSQGNLGLVQAVERFDPHRGFRLATYAMWWIRASIQEYVVHSWSLVKLGTTSEQKKLFFNLRRLKQQIRALEEGDLDAENVTLIATKLNVPEADVIHMNRRLAGADASLNAPLRDEGEAEWQDRIMDDGEDQEDRLAAAEEQAYRRRLLSGALDSLSERERSIISERHLTEAPKTLEQLSVRFGISRERVRQIEVGALAKIRKSVDRAARRKPPALPTHGTGKGGDSDACLA